MKLKMMEMHKVKPTESETQLSSEEGEVGSTLPPVQQREEEVNYVPEEEPISRNSSSKEKPFLPKVKGGFRIATAWAEEGKAGKVPIELLCGGRINHNFFNLRI